MKYDLSIALTTDEELSQASQLRYLAAYLNPVAGARVFSLDSNFGFVSIAGLGALQMEIKVKGRSVHSGLSHLGVNAVEQAVPILQALLDLKSKVIRKLKSGRASRHRPQIHAASPEHQYDSWGPQGEYRAR